MNKTFTTIKGLLVFTSLALSNLSFSQNELAIYNFNGTGSETCGNRIVAPSTTPTPNANVTFGDFTALNVTCLATANQFNNDSWNASSNVDLTEYVEFTMTADNGFVINLDSIYFDLRSSQPGGFLHVRSSLDNYASDFTTVEILDGSTWTVMSPIVIPSAYFTFRNIFTSNFSDLSAITFRFYATEVLAGTTTIRLDNVIPYGNTSTSSASISKIENQLNASISPNPGNEDLTIQLTEKQKKVNLTMTDASGKVVSQIDLKDIDSHSINTSDLMKGVYFIQLTNVENHSTFRWIKN